MRGYEKWKIDKEDYVWDIPDNNSIVIDLRSLFAYLFIIIFCHI